MKSTPAIPSVEDMRRRMRAKASGKTPESLESIGLKQRIDQLEKCLREGAPAPAPTREEIRKGIGEILEKYGVEPAEELVKILLEKDAGGNLKMTRSERAKWWSELMQYRNSKLRSVEHTGRVDGNMTIMVIKYSTGEVIEQKPLQLESQGAIDVEIEKSPM